MSHRIDRRREATLTNNEYCVAEHRLLQCSCPECSGLQWHPQGKAECIYCGEEMSIRTLKAVPAITPETSDSEVGIATS